MKAIILFVNLLVLMKASVGAEKAIITLATPSLSPSMLPSATHAPTAKTSTPTKSPISLYPTRAPFSTRPTVAPTTNDTTQRPTAAPYKAPTLNTGWIYVNYYLTSSTNLTAANCPAITTSSSITPDYVVARRLGNCFANFTSSNDDDKSSTATNNRDDSIANYYVYSCSNKAGSLTATQYDNYMCTGTPIGTVTVPITSLGEDEEENEEEDHESDENNNAYFSCSKSMCSSSSTLPLPENVPYTVQEEYQSYLLTGTTPSQQCYNVEQMIAYVNNKCLAFTEDGEDDEDDDGNKNNGGSAYIFSFPNVFVYNTANCSTNSLLFNFSMPTGCFPSDDDENEGGNKDATISTDSSAGWYGSDQSMKFGFSTLSLLMPTAGMTPVKANIVAHLKKSFVSSHLAATTSAGSNRIQTQGNADDDDYTGEPQAYMYSAVTISSSSPSSAAVLSEGAIAGIVIGSVAVVAIVIAALVASGVIGGGVLLGRAALKAGKKSGKTDMELTQNPVYGQNKV